MPGWSEAALGRSEGQPIAHRTFKSGFKKIRAPLERLTLAAVLGHLWGSAFNGG